MQELLEEVYETALNLHTVETGVSRDLCSVSEVLHSLLDVMKTHFARRFANDRPALDVNQLFGIDCGRPEGQPPVRIQRPMRDGTLMPELNEYQATGTVNSIGNTFPTGALFFVVDSRGSVPTLSLFAYKSALCDDQTGPSPLRVILSHQLIRDLALVLGSCAR